jgi:recombination protein RecR
MSLPDPLVRLIDELQRLPGIGPKGAQRLAFHILRTPREQVDALGIALRDVKEQVTYCSICNNITAVDPCAYCRSADRDRHIICVVEEPQNVGAVEKTREFKGLYHVLMGAISPLQGIGPDDLKIKSLLARISGSANGAPESPGSPGTSDGSGRAVQEVILATNPNVEGEATAIYLARLLKPLGVRVTRIAMGVPVGSDLDYTDEVTMHKAIEGRREV